MTFTCRQTDTRKGESGNTRRADWNDPLSRELFYEQISASTNAEASAILEGDEHIDVLFTDLGLREDLQAGLELAKLAVERRPALKVLYTTGQAVTDGMRALFVEKSAMLPKPYTVEQLRGGLSMLGISDPQRDDFKS
jgi:CheY-like chemotaxis protein